ncbi:hypothetical protein MLD38_003472 [Melastoma candidum]|uniref:Uncharacterized protein n=1 Tax=Melastoma candidum TaxID=119954 RepID=A0ACB9S490_9MYRT|nr:hypothetical protein MLD38_003472 [Melastoma candidum]
MPDRRFNGRSTPRSRLPARRCPPRHRHRPSRGCSPSATPPYSRNRRSDPVTHDEDRGWDRQGEQYSPPPPPLPRRFVEEGDRDWGVEGNYPDSRRNVGCRSRDEFGRIVGVDDAVWSNPVEAREDGDYGGYGQGGRYSPPRWQQAENDARGIVEDSDCDESWQQWRRGYGDGNSNGYDEFTRTDCVDADERVMMAVGRCLDGQQGKSGPWEPLQMENDVRLVSEDFQKDGRPGYQQTTRESDDKMREDSVMVGRSDRRDCRRGEHDAMMGHTNERICSKYGELASETVQSELLQKRGRDFDNTWRIGLNNCSGWSPGNTYRSGDGRVHKSKEVLNRDYGIQTNISMVPDESLMKFPGFLHNSSREAYHRRAIDYGHTDPYGAFGRSRPFLEGMPSQRGLSPEGELPRAISVSQLKMCSHPCPQVDVKRGHVPVNSRCLDSSCRNVNHEAHALSPHSESSREYEFLVHGVSCHRHDCNCSTKDLNGVSKYYMHLGFKRDDYGIISDICYDKIRERYGLQNPSSSRATHSLLNGIDEMDSLENSSESQRSHRGGYDIGPSYVRVEDRLLGLSGVCPDYSKESYAWSDHLHYGNGEGYKGDHCSWLRQDDLENEILTEHDQATREGEWPFRVKHTAEEMGATSPYDEIRLRSWHCENDKLGKRKLREGSCEIRANNEKFPAAMYEDKQWTVENNNVCSQFHHDMFERTPGKETGKRLPVHMRLDFRKPDIRKRLGPPLKITRFCEVTDLSDDEDDNYTKVEPSEDSEEFKLLVNSHFLRYFKFLNETSAQRRKYTNQGGSGTFRCRVCGSNSKEFGDVKALAMHMFMCQAFGLRSEHLGFHKAICVLVGWDSSYSPDMPWVPRQISGGAASDFRSSLIIWPPVVVICNSSLARPTSEERTLVTIEDLEKILKGWGYGNGKKITRGNPANDNVLIVIYKATLSGLLEAKKLGKFFAEKCRGKVDLQNMVSGGRQQAVDVARDAASSLYGYLGVSEDLEHLDFETKKRCVIRSLKEIQNTVNARK